jgi:regulator of nucleoside diphosphate kinase
MALIFQLNRNMANDLTTGDGMKQLMGMNNAELIALTEHDYIRLKRLLDELARQSQGMQPGLTTLEEILDSARVVDPQGIPENVVTMNSRVLFEDVLTRNHGTVTIVYPADADPSAEKISVLSPVGAALIGECAGREVELPLPYGKTRRIRIIDVLYQPEAQGEFAL